MLPVLLLLHLLCFLLLPAYELVRDFFLAHLLHDDIESLGLLKVFPLGLVLPQEFSVVYLLRG